MSISSEIDRIISATSSAYGAVSTKGGTLPAVDSRTIANLSTAIATIPTGTTPTGTLTVTANGTYNVTNYASCAVAIPVYNGTVTTN